MYLRSPSHMKSDLLRKQKQMVSNEQGHETEHKQHGDKYRRTFSERSENYLLVTCKYGNATG